MRSVVFAVAVTCWAGLQSTSLQADDKLGKLFVKASPTVSDGQEFKDEEKEASANDIKKNAHDWIVVETQDEADYTLNVVERRQTNNVDAEVVATVSVKENGKWVPGTRVTGRGSGFTRWGICARRLLGNLGKWVSERNKK